MSRSRLDKLLSNLGYGSRKEVASWLKAGRLTDSQGTRIKSVSEKVLADEVMLDGAPLDPAALYLILHKPKDHTCSHRDRPPLVFDLFPTRFGFRKPALSTVGRLDRDTTGTLLLTDDGPLLHRLTSPRYKRPKVYRARLLEPITDEALERLAQGGWYLPDDPKPLAPAPSRRLDTYELEITLTEGRYHQVKRMLEAVGNRVVDLHRTHFAGLSADDLQPGQWRELTLAERRFLDAGGTGETEEILP